MKFKDGYEENDAYKGVIRTHEIYKDNDGKYIDFVSERPNFEAIARARREAKEKAYKERYAEQQRIKEQHDAEIRAQYSSTSHVCRSSNEPSNCGTIRFFLFKLTICSVLTYIILQTLFQSADADNGLVLGIISVAINIVLSIIKAKVTIINILFNNQTIAVIIALGISALIGESISHFIFAIIICAAINIVRNIIVTRKK